MAPSLANIETPSEKCKQAGRRVATLELKPSGRWPANVLLDEEAATLLDAQSGQSQSRVGAPRGADAGQGWGMTATGAEYNDFGGASRFFYTAKASTAEREVGLDHLPRKTAGELTGRTDGTAGLESPRTGAGRTSSGRANTHPTVKPVDLMAYLVRLVTPKGGTVLDPFMGSGTTGMAAAIEDCQFIGIDLDPHHVEIARGRIAAAVRRDVYVAPDGKAKVDPRAPAEVSLFPEFDAPPAPAKQIDFIDDLPW